MPSGPEDYRLDRLLKKSRTRVPRGLKSARDIKNKGLSGTAEAVPFQNSAKLTFSAASKSSTMQ